MHVAQFVLGPVEDVEGVPEAVGVGGTQLQVHVDVAVGVEVGEVELEGVGAGEGNGRAPITLAGYQTGNIHLVWHAVAVVVQVVEVGRVVAVAVHVPLLPVQHAIVGAVGDGGIAVPHLPAEAEAGNFVEVGHAVKVAVFRQGVCAEQRFGGIGEAVAVAVGGVVGGLAGVSLLVHVGGGGVGLLDGLVEDGCVVGGGRFLPGLEGGDLVFG